jgi:hypothetical protein
MENDTIRWIVEVVVILGIVGACTAIVLGVNAACRALWRLVRR